MSGFTGVLVLLFVIAASLLLVGFADHMQTRRHVLQHKLQQMTLRIGELEEICAGVEPLIESILVPRLINDEILDLAQSIKRLDPNATSIDIKLEQAKELAEKFAAGQRSQPFYRVLPDEAAIAKHKQFLTEAGRIVRRHHALGRIQNADMESSIRELGWSHMMLDVVSLVVLGHQAVNRNDPVVAYGYYKRAQNLLMTSHLQDDRRHRLVREIDEILEGKRLALDEELMPESAFNPTQKPIFSNLNPTNLESAKPLVDEHKAK